MVPDERIMKNISNEMEQLGCPKDLGGLSKLNEDFIAANPNSLEHALECIS